MSSNARKGVYKTTLIPTVIYRQGVYVLNISEVRLEILELKCLRNIYLFSCPVITRNN